MGERRSTTIGLLLRGTTAAAVSTAMLLGPVAGPAFAQDNHGQDNPASAIGDAPAEHKDPDDRTPKNTPANQKRSDNRGLKNASSDAQASDDASVGGQASKPTSSQTNKQTETKNRSEPNQQPRITPTQAARKAQKQYRGRVLNVVLEHGPGGAYYQVKLLDRGSIRVVHIEAR